MSNNRNELIKPESFNLPTDVVKDIFSLLKPKELATVSQVCRFFKTQAEDNRIWRKKFMERFFFEPPKKLESVKQYYREFNTSLKKTLDVVMALQVLGGDLYKMKFHKKIDNIDFRRQIANLFNLLQKTTLEANLTYDDFNKNLVLSNHIYNAENIISSLVQLKKSLDLLPKGLIENREFLQKMVEDLSGEHIETELLSHSRSIPTSPAPLKLVKLESYSDDKFDMLLVMVAIACLMGGTAVLSVVFKKYPGLVNIELSITDSHAQEYGYNFLDIAISSLQVDVVSLLIEHGADINKLKDEFHIYNSIPSALYRSITVLCLLNDDRTKLKNEDSFNKISNLIQLLLKNGANPDLECLDNFDESNNGNKYSPNNMRTPRALCEAIYEKMNERSKEILKIVLDRQPNQKHHKDNNAQIFQVKPK